MENRKYNIIQPLLLSIILALGMLIGYSLNISDRKSLISKIDKNSSGKVGRVEEVIRFIESKYLFKTNQDKFVEKALQSITAELDPFSIYIPADKTKEINNKLNGIYTGIGIASYFINDTLIVLRVIQNSPAMKAGIKPLDKILQAGNYILTGDSINYFTVRKIISGFGNKPFDLVIKDRNNNNKILTVNTVKLDNKSITSYTLQDSVLYLKIEHFSNHTYREFMQILEKNAKDDKINNLIVDLRDNPGGYLEEVTKMLDQLFDKSKLDLVTTVYHDGRKDIIKTSGRNFYTVNNIVVLINENSASGSEVFAGVLQDYDRATIIGNPSYGKGLVQEQFSLDNGGALRLTIANYYLPTGRSIQKMLDLDTNYVNSLSSHYEKKDTFFSFYENRPLISGRGIYPDYFVEDTMYSQLQHVLYEYDSILVSKAVEYIKKNKDLYDISEEDFVNNYDISSDSMLNIKNSKISLEGIEAYNYMLKSKIAFIMFGKNAEEKVLNRIDPYIKEAEKYLRDTISNLR